ncbi:hypothetical protein BKA66DRAFT_108868 [Pyrenochaeta sp. MPI-SDFR-AT-0127]|nr:hypothetical protein BKA66DRAFT_108868 [Pyrenochaeta sp. MPI-SDFR-AT-0127]
MQSSTILWPQDRLLLSRRSLRVVLGGIKIGNSTSSLLSHLHRRCEATIHRIRKNAWDRVKPSLRSMKSIISPSSLSLQGADIEPGSEYFPTSVHPQPLKILSIRASLRSALCTSCKWWFSSLRLHVYAPVGLSPSSPHPEHFTQQHGTLVALRTCSHSGSTEELRMVCDIKARSGADNDLRSAVASLLPPSPIPQAGWASLEH